ncbi:MAG: hypothetical protein AB7G68_20450 [Nitrospiraceae bacterium]
MVNAQHSDQLAEPHYSLHYGMRLEKGTTDEMTHPHVRVILPDGAEGSMTLHVINGTADEIKAHLLESVDAFFEIYAGVDSNVPCRR